MTFRIYQDQKESSSILNAKDVKYAVPVHSISSNYFLMSLSVNFHFIEIDIGGMVCDVKYAVIINLIH